MRIQYRSAVPADAVQLLEYLRAVGSESDNLSFGPEGIPFSVEQEQALLARMETSSHSRFFLALDGTRIVGNACVDGSGNPRFAHRRNLAVSVLREYWGQGIGSGLMERMIAFARESGAGEKTGVPQGKARRRNDGDKARREGAGPAPGGCGDPRYSL